MEPTLFSERDSFDSFVLRWMALEKECQITHRIVETFEVTVDPLPNMQDRDLNLVEHEVIVQYLQERYPGDPLLPVDPKIRAQIRQMCTLIRRGTEDFVEQMAALLSHGNKFITGEEFTLADIYAGCRLHLLLEEKAMPLRVAKYYSRLAGRGAFKEAQG